MRVVGLFCCLYLALAAVISHFSPNSCATGLNAITIASAATGPPGDSRVGQARFETALLDRVGCTRPIRDAVDRRVIADYRARRGKRVNSPAAVGGYPQLVGASAPRDSDGDGMSDAWEKSRKLNPSDARDGAKDRNRDGYTNLEEYLNSLVP